MNVSEYIESGILDVYVLGGLSPSEVEEVEQKATLHPEVALEIENLRKVFEEVLLSQKVQPPLSLKAKILDAIPDDSKKSRSNGKSLILSSYSYWAIAASWLVTLIVGALAFYYRDQWKQTESKMMALETQRQEMAEQFNFTKLNFEEANRRLSLVSDSSIKRISLKKLPNIAATAFAQVMWNPNQGELFINATYMPTTPEGKQYQLWAIVDGKPVDAGIIPEEGSLEFVQMKHILHATAFAITLEQKGGSPVPTMEQMYVMGGV